jgi:lipopolysaccharide biosynthesis glycosyltransferase
MNYAYMICSKDFWPYAKICLNSLSNQCNCIIYLICHGWINGNIKNFEKELHQFSSKLNIISVHIKSGQWEKRRMLSKINIFCSFVQNTIVENDSRILSLDTDMVFKDDPFKIFDKYPSSDIIITGRYYAYYFPINAGLWGIRKNKKSIAFIKFFKEQINKPTWKPYCEWLKKFKHFGDKDWYIDQDFLCTIEKHKLPFECKIAKASHVWNFCPFDSASDGEKIFKEMALAEMNPDIRVLHYKSILKKRMLEIWGPKEN